MSGEGGPTLTVRVLASFNSLYMYPKDLIELPEYVVRLRDGGFFVSSISIGNVEEAEERRW